MLVEFGNVALTDRRRIARDSSPLIDVDPLAVTRVPSIQLGANNVARPIPLLLPTFAALTLACAAQADEGGALRTRTTLTPTVQPARAAAQATRPQPTPAAIAQVLGSVPAYALEMRLTFARQYSTFDVSSPASSASIGPQPSDSTLWTATFVGDDFSKQYLIGDENVLRTISTSDATVTDVGPAVPPVDGEYWVGMKWDPTTDTVFAVACNHVVGIGCHLYTIDPATAAVATVAPLAGGAADYLPVDIAINSAGEIYAVSIIDPYDNYLIKIDKTNGDVQVIGPTGVNAAYAQGMDFDKSTDTLYWTAFGALGAGGAFQGQVYTVDVATGAVTLIGPTPNGGSEIWALAIATSAPSTEGQAWNFDDVAAPALPAGWTTSADGIGSWTTQSDVSDSAPNAAHVAEAEAAGEASLYSPVVTAAAGSELAFRHRWALETSPYDGGVLEISIDGAPFDDILAAGGSFVSGGYTNTMFGCCGGNPIGARAAWAGGTQATFLNTRVALPAAAAGHAVQFRWRFGTDSSTAAPGANGWWIDSVTLGTPGANGPAAALSAASLAIEVPAGATVAAPITLTDVGTAALDYSAAFAASDCAAPGGVSWLSSTPASGQLAAGASSALWIAVNASALPAGEHSALLCVSTNDPDHAVLAVPVTATVTPSAAGDGLFCSGFESGEDGHCGGGGTVIGDVVRSGPLNWAVPADLDGIAIDLVTGVHGPWSEDQIADINLYASDDGNGDSLHVYWYADLVTEAAVGGVVDVGGAGILYSVLQSGAMIGPYSTVFFAPNSTSLDNWLPGATGYLGLEFYNEQTGQLNYGYVHLQAGAGAGFPATVLDYAYDRSGNPITIP